MKDTIGSLKQWGYRTKITPHFDAPPKKARRAVEATLDGGEEDEMNAEGVNGEGGGGKKWVCRIGFERKGRPGVMDIEVSGTRSVQLLKLPRGGVTYVSS